MIKNTQILVDATILLGPIQSGKEVSSVCLFFCNTVTNQQRILSIFAIPSGQTVQSDGNVIVKDFSIPQGDTFTFQQEKIILQAGDRVVQSANNTGITQTISYIEL